MHGAANAVAGSTALAPSADQISKNQEKWVFKKTSKNDTAKSGLLVDFDIKKGLDFRGGSVIKITKIRDVFKMGPQVSKLSPRAFKTTQNHESDNPKSKKSQKKDHPQSRQS